MPYTSTTRDRYRLAVWATTGTVAAGAIAATGWVAGVAAQDQARVDVAKQADQDAQARAEYAAWQARYGGTSATRRTRAVVRQHPVRTRITTRYVVAARQLAPVGPGGALSAPSATTTSPTPSSTPSSTAQNPTPNPTGGGSQPPQPQPPPPPPPPPPTPTSGS